MDLSPVQRVLDRHVKWRLNALAIMDRVLSDHPGALDEHGPRDQVAVVIQIESSRMFGERGDAPTIRIIASHAEVDSYRPGMGIHLQVRPLARENPFRSPPSGEVKS